MEYDCNYSKFDIKQHKAKYVHYLEVIIREDGTIEYAHPCHQEKLIEIACQRLGLTREELCAMCPPEYYGDFTVWLCRMSGAVSVWEDFIIYDSLNNLQRLALCKLK